MEKGRHIIVRMARQNAEAKQARLDSEEAREARRKEIDAETASALNVTSLGAEPSAPSKPKTSRKRKADASNAPPGSRRTRYSSSKRGKRI